MEGGILLAQDRQDLLALGQLGEGDLDHLGRRQEQGENKGEREIRRNDSGEQEDKK